MKKRMILGVMGVLLIGVVLFVVLRSAESQS